MSATAKGGHETHTPAITSSAVKTKRKSKVRHVYYADEGEVAAAMGVQVRMHCGVWGWPRQKPSSHWFSSDDLTPRHCKRCARVVAAEERKYGKTAD